MAELFARCNGRGEARKSDRGVGLVVVVVVRGDEMHRFSLFMFDDETGLM